MSFFLPPPFFQSRSGFTGSFLTALRILHRVCLLIFSCFWMLDRVITAFHSSIQQLLSLWRCVRMFVCQLSFWYWCVVRIICNSQLVRSIRMTVPAHTHPSAWWNIYVIYPTHIERHSKKIILISHQVKAQKNKNYVTIKNADTAGCLNVFFFFASINKEYNAVLCALQSSIALLNV